MSDLWLLLKIRSRRFDEVIKEYISSISRNEWLVTFNLWKIRLQKYIDDERGYFEHF